MLATENFKKFQEKCYKRCKLSGGGGPHLWLTLYIYSNRKMFMFQKNSRHYLGTLDFLINVLHAQYFLYWFSYQHSLILNMMLLVSVFRIFLINIFSPFSYNNLNAFSICCGSKIFDWFLTLFYRGSRIYFTTREGV